MTAPLVYVALPTPHLTANLTSFGATLLFSDGIVLLPDKTQATGAAWQFAFSAPDRTDAAKTLPASIALTLSTPDDTSTVSAPVDTTPDDTTTTTGSSPTTVTTVVPPSFTGSDPVAPVTAPTAAASAPSATAPVAPVRVSATRTSTVSFGYAYPVVLLLPLVLLFLVPAVARALMRDLTPPGES